jgi:hypothetical protein
MAQGTGTPGNGGSEEHKPFVPQHVEMKEFTIGTLVLGLIMTVVLGAANAYLGLKAGQTIAATYPAAVISMAWLRLRKGTILQENIARTAGSIGESVAAGAVFTLPAFIIAGRWPSFEGPGRVSALDRPHDHRVGARRAVRLAGATRDGRGPDASRSRIDRRRPRSTRPDSVGEERRSTCS